MSLAGDADAKVHGGHDEQHLLRRQECDLRMTGAEIARASRAAQGLPATITDDATLDDLAALIVASIGRDKRVR